MVKLTAKWLAAVAVVALGVALIGGAIYADKPRAQIRQLSGMEGGRVGHTATLLGNGKVLVAGGWNGKGLTTAELYNPATGTFEPTGSLLTPRVSFVAELLENGKVLIAGGHDGEESPEFGKALRSAELYDPRTGLFEETGSMTVDRCTCHNECQRLPTGQVFFAGGYADGEYLASAEIYDPETGTFEPTGSMPAGVAHQSTALLKDGRVLLAGGCGDDDQTENGYFSMGQIYDPESGRFEETGSLTSAVCCLKAVVLESGKVLFAGGDNGEGRIASSQLFNPKTGNFEETGSLSRPNSGYTATLLRDGGVLIAGGWDGEPLDTVEVYDPRRGKFATVGKLEDARDGHTATLLASGEVLLVGGRNHRGVLKGASVVKTAM